MCKHEAQELIRQAIQRMKDRDDPQHKLEPAEYVFATEDVFTELQATCSQAEIRKICELLAEERCDCGTTDPFICGATFSNIIHAMFEHPREIAN
jgi:hypothetical protein